MINLLEGEKIILEKRKHWYALAIESVGLFIIALVPFFLIIISLNIEGTEGVVAQYWGLIVFSVSAWLLGVWMIFFIVWTNYHLDVLFITDYRIIDVEQKGLFSRDLAEVHLANIEDVKVVVSGMLPSLLGFGDLYIQTAGMSREIVIKKIEHPNEVREIISQQHRNALTKDSYE